MITQLVLMGLWTATQLVLYTVTALMVGFAGSVGWHLGKRWVLR